MDQATVTLIISIAGSVIFGSLTFASSLIISRSKASRVYAEDLSRQLAAVRAELKDLQAKYERSISEVARLREDNLNLMRRELARGV